MSEGPAEVAPMSMWAAIGWAVATYFLYIFLAALFLSGDDPAPGDLVTIFGCQVAAYSLGLFGVLRMHAPETSIRDFIGLRSTSGWFYALAIGLGLSLLLPVNALYSVIVERLPGDVPGEQLVDTLRKASPSMRWALAAIFVLFVPMLEETFYRGALFRPVFKRYGAVGVIVATGLLFAVVHEYRGILPIFVMGLALGYVRWQSGSIVPALLLHMAFNAVPFYEAYLAAGEPPAESTTDDVAWSLVALSTVAAAGCVALAPWLGRTRESAHHAKMEDYK